MINPNLSKRITMKSKNIYYLTLNFTTIFLLLSFCSLKAQDVEKSLPFDLSGSADIYYKTDFSGDAQIPTSFMDDYNSMSIGMLNLIASKEMGKTSFVGDISFGPRSNGSLPDALFHIQNLYISYAFTKKIALTAGYMGTFVGYEVISPTANFNYSTSYLFTNGPFQNGGIKLDVALTDKLGLMLGLFNNWNGYTDPDGLNDLGAQLSIAPVDGWDIYLNFVTSFKKGENPGDGTELDLTTGYQLNDELYLGLNAAYWTADMSESDAANFLGAALYANYALTDNVALGGRVESFSTENTGYIGAIEVDNKMLEAKNVAAFTLSANINNGPLTFIPEIRFDVTDENIFINADDELSNAAAQIGAAAVFSF